jgi:hypothetical protein
MECCKFLSVQKGGFFASFTDSARDREGQQDSQTEILQETRIGIGPFASPSVGTVINGSLPNLSFDLSSLCLAGRDIAYIIS